MVSDFDYTLSRFHDAEGKSCLTTHGVFDNAAWTVSRELGVVLEKLKTKYLPIEFDPHITVAEKIPHMEDWYDFTRYLCFSRMQIKYHFLIE